jgi:hypothetical protein
VTGQSLNTLVRSGGSSPLLTTSSEANRDLAVDGDTSEGILALINELPLGAALERGKPREDS